MDLEGDSTFKNQEAHEVKVLTEEGVGNDLDDKVDIECIEQGHGFVHNER